MDKKFHPTLYNECDFLSMSGLKLIHVSKRGPWWFQIDQMHHLINQSMLMTAWKAIHIIKMVYCLTFLCWQDKLYMLQYEEYRNLNTRHPYLHIHTNSYSTISSDTIFYGIWYQCIRSNLNCESSTTFYTIIEMKKITHKNRWKLFSCTSMSMITQTVRCQWKHQSKINCFRPVDAMKV